MSVEITFVDQLAGKNQTKHQGKTLSVALVTMVLNTMNPSSQYLTSPTMVIKDYCRRLEALEKRIAELEAKAKTARVCQLSIVSSLVSLERS